MAESKTEQESGAGYWDIIGDSAADIEHLTKNHQVTKAAMNGRLILAPEVSQRDTCASWILQRQTVSKTRGYMIVLYSYRLHYPGLWLRDISQDLKAPYVLVGADLTPGFFPAAPHTALIRQDIQRPWPKGLHGTFDIFHQRTGLASARVVPPEQCVKQLTQLLKPGGWIQLMEMDLMETHEDGPAAKEFIGVLMAMFKKIGSQPKFNLPGQMMRMLRDAGLVDVREEVVRVPSGRRWGDPEMVNLNIDAHSRSVDVVCKAFKGFGVDLPEDIWDDLPKRYREEIEAMGGEIRLIAAMGRMPA